MTGDEKLTALDREIVQEWLYRRHNSLRTYRKPERRDRWVRQILADKDELTRYTAQAKTARGTHSSKWPLRTRP